MSLTGNPYLVVSLVAFVLLVIAYIVLTVVDKRDQAAADAELDRELHRPPAAPQPSRWLAVMGALAVRFEASGRHHAPAPGATAEAEPDTAEDDEPGEAAEEAAPETAPGPPAPLAVTAAPVSAGELDDLMARFDTLVAQVADTDTSGPGTHAPPNVTGPGPEADHEPALDLAEVIA